MAPIEMKSITYLLLGPQILRLLVRPRQRVFSISELHEPPLFHLLPARATTAMLMESQYVSMYVVRVDRNRVSPAVLVGCSCRWSNRTFGG